MTDFVAGLRAWARRSLGIERLHNRIDHLEAQVRAIQPGGSASSSEGWETSRGRWRTVEPDAGLTWGRQISGDAFISKVSERGGFGPAVRILEIGPGYGRLLRACLTLNMSFAEYLGLDISPSNVEYLQRQFTDARVQFMLGDAEKTALDRPFDLLISSLVFKHLYPTFEETLRNCATALVPGALTCFDLIEGAHSLFEDDGLTYIKTYERPQVTAILDRTGFDLEAFDSVEHDESHVRLLVVGRRRAAA